MIVHFSISTYDIYAGIRMITSICLILKFLERLAILIHHLQFIGFHSTQRQLVFYFYLLLQDLSEDNTNIWLSFILKQLHVINFHLFLNANQSIGVQGIGKF